MTGLLLAALLATDGGTPEIPVVQAVESGSSIVVHGPGRFLNEPAWIELAQRHKALEVERDELQKSRLGSFLLVGAVGVVVGVAGGVALGFALKK